MGKLLKWSLLGIACVGFTLVSFGNEAQSKTLDVFGKPLDMHGFVVQETAWRTGGPESFHNVSDYFTAQLEAAYVINEHVEFFGIFRFFYDWAYNINSGHDWWEKGGNPSRGGYDGSRRNMQFSSRYHRDRDLDLPRELYVDIHLGNLDLRLGKQQVVWGETDGLRLMDVVNPSDWQREFILRDSDEGYESTRIPLWLIKAEYFFDKPWFGGLLIDHSIEIIINPCDNEVNRFNIGGGNTKDMDNRYVSTVGDFTNEGGAWAFPHPKFPSWYQASLTDKRPNGEWEFGARFRGAINEWYFSLNAWYGIQHMPVWKWTHTSFDLNGNPNDGIAQDPDFVANGGHFVQCNLEAEYQRQKILGFTLNKDLVEWIHIWNSSPVLRVEALYEFDKPFNNMGKRMKDLQWAGLPASSTAGAIGVNIIPDSDPNNYDGVVNHDQKTVIPIDYVRIVT